MIDFPKRAIDFLQKRFPRAPVLNKEMKLLNNITGETVKEFYPMIALDPDSGIKQRLLAVHDFGSDDEVHHFAVTLSSLINELDQSAWVSLGYTNLPSGHEINTGQMLFSPKVLIYTNKLCVSYSNVLEIFKKHGYIVEIIDEEKLHETLFISYGSPDESYVSLINNYLKMSGIKTWFFHDDAVPGQKLHRVMHEGVNNYDRVLLVCSKDSLSRHGVLNELERVLEREAKEGGKEILIPITLDDYVYKDWAPNRPDLADQVRSRVITKLPKSTELTDEFKDIANKLLVALKRKQKANSYFFFLICVHLWFH